MSEFKITWSCKHDECASCSGGTYETRKVAGETRNWFVECGCECHLPAEEKARIGIE